MTPTDAHPPRPGYAIRGGTADADRLARQARVMAPATEAFLARAGLAPGVRCLDLGCGGGQVTVHMARVAGPGAAVLGVDRDEEALAIARRRAADAGVGARFTRGDADAPPRRAAFELAFARLLLSHLADPMAALRAMRVAVRPGGVVAVEDLDASTLRSEPPRPALGRLAEVYAATVRAGGGDPTIGPRLPAMLACAGLEDVDARVIVNPMRAEADKVFLAELVDNMREAMLAAGAATAGELDELRAAVAGVAAEPGTTVLQAAMHQVWGVRPPAQPQ